MAVDSYLSKVRKLRQAVSERAQALPSINTYITNPRTGDKKALVHNGVATLGLQERKSIVEPWLNSMGCA